MNAFNQNSLFIIIYLYIISKWNGWSNWRVFIKVDIDINLPWKTCLIIPWIWKTLIFAVAVSDFKPFSVSINITNNDNTAEVYRVKFISHPITVGASLHLYSTVWSLSGVWFYCCGLLPYMWMVWTNACLSQLHQTLHINVYPSWVKHWKFSSWPVQQEFLRNRLISMWTKTCFVKSFSWQR